MTSARVQALEGEDCANDTTPGSGWQGNGAAMKADRDKHTATAIDANPVLVVAGTSNADPNATTAELYFQP